MLKKFLPYIIFGIIFIIGIILIIVGTFKDRIFSLNAKTYYITLNGEKQITLYQGSLYVEPGYNAVDKNGKDLTGDVVVDNQVNINVIGKYKINYILNGVVVETRNVNIVEKPIGATFIHLLGDMTMYLNVGDEYIEPGYEVVDSIDGTLKDKVVIKSNLNNGKAGIYQIIYSVVNSGGVTTSKKRTIVIMDTDISLTLDNMEYTNGNVKINLFIIDNYNRLDYIVLPNGNTIKDNSYSYEVSNNGIYKFIFYDKFGKSEEKSIEVNNIDKTKPTGSCNGSYKDGISKINIDASDNLGISKYVINNVSYYTNVITINGEFKNVNIILYDTVGNNNVISCNLNNNNTSKSSSKTPSPSSKSSSKTPSPSPSSNIKKATKNIFVGDSRTVGMCKTITGDAYHCSYSAGGITSGNDTYIAQTSAGYTWFSNTAIPAVNNILKNNSNTTYNIISLMGVNHVTTEVNYYIPKYNELSTSNWKNHNIILVSVTPVNETLEANHGYNVKNTSIEAFNDRLKKLASSNENIKYCDVYNKIKNNFGSRDGLHYDKTTYNNIYNYIIECINS